MNDTKGENIDQELGDILGNNHWFGRTGRMNTIPNDGTNINPNLRNTLELPQTGNLPSLASESVQPSADLEEEDILFARLASSLNEAIHSLNTFYNFGETRIPLHDVIPFINQYKAVFEECYGNIEPSACLDHLNTAIRSLGLNFKVSPFDSPNLVKLSNNDSFGYTDASATMEA